MARPVAKAGQGEGHGQRSRRRATALIAYFDTSSFIKLVVEEPGTLQTATVWESAERRVSSRLLYPEARAALAAARRAGRLDREGVESARRVLDGLWQAVEDFAVTGEVARRAGDLAEDLALKGYDAVHLATAEAVLDPEGVLAAADVRLAAAAQALGLPVARLL